MRTSCALMLPSVHTMESTLRPLYSFWFCIHNSSSVTKTRKCSKDVRGSGQRASCRFECWAPGDTLYLGPSKTRHNRVCDEVCRPLVCQFSNRFDVSMVVWFVQREKVATWWRRTTKCISARSHGPSTNCRSRIYFPSGKYECEICWN